MRSDSLPRLFPIPAAAPLVLALAGSVPAQGNVLVVDDDLGPGVDFFDLQPAVDAAVDGDLILVRDGNYSTVNIAAKSLTLQAESSGAVVQVAGPFVTSGPAIRVANTSRDQPVVVRGLETFAVGATSGEVPLQVSNCLGPVVFEDCEFRILSGDGAVITASDSVTFVDCLVDPGRAYYDSYEGIYLTRTGVLASDSSLYLYGTTVLGPIGPDADSILFQLTPPGIGGDALNLSSSTLFASGSVLLGGQGGSGVPGLCTNGNDGGDGVQFATSNVHLLDTTVLGGTGGQPTPACGGLPGNDGLDLNGSPGAVTQHPGTARSFTAGSPVVEGTSVPFTFTGDPGDTVLLLVSIEPEVGVLFPAFGVVQLVQSPWASLAMGTIPASGVLQVSLPIPQLLPTTQFQRYPGQALMITPSSGVFGSGPSTVTLLDASF